MSVEITTLPSGLRVITDAMPGLETAALGVYIGAGARHEKKSEHGLSHLLEHMAFKGTRRRSARAIAEEIEAAGGDLNAATSVEHTAYYARVLAGDAALGLDILSDILTESTFDKAELEREKGVILQEIGSVADTPDDLVFELFTETAFPGQAIGRPILGTAERVKGFNRASVNSYLSSHYSAGRMVVAAAGAVEHARIVGDVAARFAKLGKGGAKPQAKARYVGGEARLAKRLEQSHVVVGFESPSYLDPANYAAHIFANAVGGGMSSRLFQEVREERGLAYAIHTFNWAFSDTGLFGFYAGAAKSDMAELMPLSLDCIAKAAQDLSEDEVRRAKAQMKVSLLVALESSGARAEQIARQLMSLGRVLTREETVARIDGLGTAEIRAAGAAILRSKPTVASIGAFPKAWTPARVGAHVRAA